MFSTNYIDAFIEVAEDTKAGAGTIPPQKGEVKSVARHEYELISANPYRYTSDDIFFMTFVVRNNIPESKQASEKELYFSKGRPCFRASPLTKTYGWGVHSDDKGRVAIYGVESKEYQQFVQNNKIKKTRAMRSKKK